MITSLPFIVAEIGGNHLGSLDRALTIIDAAAGAGADAVKIQTFEPEQMADPETVVTDGPWAGWNLLDLYRHTHTPKEWHIKLFDRAARSGIEAFSSVFHPDDVDWLETIGCSRYKIASFELTDLHLIRYAASTGKPLVISTGMGTRAEIFAAAAAAIDIGCRDLTMLKCTSAYPAKIEDANLSAMRAIAIDTGAKVGLSDHTNGSTAAIVAVAFGATMIEKHFTIDRSAGGPDAPFSVEPDEFAHMAESCRDAANAIGVPTIGPTEAERCHIALRRKPGEKRGIS